MRWHILWNAAQKIGSIVVWSFVLGEIAIAHIHGAGVIMERVGIRGELDGYGGVFRLGFGDDDRCALNHQAEELGCQVFMHADAAVGAWLVFLGLRTRGQIAVWHDDLSLWGAALSHFPYDPLANYNLAVALVGDGRLAEARAPALSGLRRLLHMLIGRGESRGPQR